LTAVGTVSTSSAGTVGGLAYWNSTGYPAKLDSVATSSLAVGASISSSGTLGSQIGGTASSLSLNMANANTWTALQSFNYSSSTIYSTFATASTTVASIGTLTLGAPLAVTSGGTGATSLNNLITLGDHTTGNYLATLANAVSGGLTVSNSGTETAAVTVGLDLANSNTWTANQIFNYSSTTYASLSTASTTNLILNGSSFNNLLGSGCHFPLEL